MKKTIILLTAIILTAIACKKNSNPPSSAGGGTTPQNTTISNGFPALGMGSINGVLYAQRFTLLNYSLTQYEAGASFSTQAKPFSFIYAVLGILIGGNSAGEVKIDSTTLKYNYTSAANNINTYLDSTNTSVYSTVKWSIGGNSSFTTFSTTVTRGYPAIANTGYIPASFSKSQPLTINFGTNYSNTDSIMVSITDNVSPTPFFIYKYLPGNAGSVTFTAAQLSGISTTSPQPEIIVYGKNYSNLSNGGKNYVFVMENDLVQFVTITP